jgi:hypothetical protein
MKFSFDVRFPDATDEQKWDQIKNWRNVELALTDWTQLPDSPVDKGLWANYRQLLRDLPQQNCFADEADIPNKPNG